MHRSGPFIRRRPVHSPSRVDTSAARSSVAECRWCELYGVGCAFYAIALGVFGVAALDATGLACGDDQRRTTTRGPVNHHVINRDSDSTTSHPRDQADSGMSRRRALSLAAKAAGGGVLVLVAAACGDDGPGRYGVAAPTTQPSAPGPEAAGSHPHDSAVDESTGAPPTTIAASGTLVRSIDNTFNPDVLTVAAGTEVTWVNGGRVEHDIVALDESWGVGVDDFKPGAEFRHTFDEPGTYEYICTLHGSTKMVGMVGTVIVT